MLRFQLNLYNYNKNVFNPKFMHTLLLDFKRHFLFQWLEQNQFAFFNYYKQSESCKGIMCFFSFTAHDFLHSISYYPFFFSGESLKHWKFNTVIDIDKIKDDL